MRAAFICCIAASLAAVCARAQEWEVGGAGGFGAYKNATVTSPTGSATVGFDNRFAVGAVLGQDLYEHLSGEIRYTYRDNDLLLSRGAQKVNMDGDTHSVHYDLLFHPTRKGSRVRPFAALGGGASVPRHRQRVRRSTPRRTCPSHENQRPESADQYRGRCKGVYFKSRHHSRRFQGLPFAVSHEAVCHLAGLPDSRLAAGFRTTRRRELRLLITLISATLCAHVESSRASWRQIVPR